MSAAHYWAGLAMGSIAVFSGCNGQPLKTVSSGPERQLPSTNQAEEEKPEPVWPHDGPVVLRQGGCTISVRTITEFKIGEGNAHAQCALEVGVGDNTRYYEHIVDAKEGVSPSPGQCLDDREKIAKHLMMATSECQDANGKGALCVPGSGPWACGSLM